MPDTVQLCFLITILLKSQVGDREAGTVCVDENTHAQHPHLILSFLLRSDLPCLMFRAQLFGKNFLQTSILFLCLSADSALKVVQCI